MVEEKRGAADARRLRWFYQDPLIFIGSLFVINALMLVVFAGFLGWI